MRSPDRLPRLTEAAIRQWVGDEALRRGRAYLRQNRLLYPRRRGNTLRALCRGNAPEPYRLWVRLDGEGIVEAACTCPMGTGGHCKHVAALLWAWRQHPELFTPEPPWHALLATLPRERLLDLIERLLDQDPTLADLVYLALVHRPEPDDTPHPPEAL